MTLTERRFPYQAPQSALERLLNDNQLSKLRELQRFGWELKFLRVPLFQPAIPIVFDATRTSFGVIDADGNLDEQSGIRIR